MSLYIEPLRPDELQHHGILGMKWGIRRYQNKDGTLTPAGRKRLKLDRYDNDHKDDLLLKKGTVASRVVRTSRYSEYENNTNAAQQYVKDVLEKDSKLDSKYLSVDNVRNSGRHNGKDFYVGWFTNGGWEPENAQVTSYKLNRDVKIASGKKVIDALVEEYGSIYISEMLKEQNPNVSKLALAYTNDRGIKEKINDRFKKAGYDGVEDINDLNTDMPIILFDSKINATRSKTIQSGKDAIDEILKKR